MKKTGAIVATILTSLFCGLPGLILAGIGLLGIMPGSAPQSSSAFQDTLLGGVLFIGGGIVLILIPVIVGILSFRNKKVSEVATPASVKASPQPAIASPSPVSQPQPAIASPSLVSQPQPAIPSPSPANQPPAEEPLPSFLQPADNSGDIRTRLMQLNRSSAPYQIIDGQAENVDLIAEWKIVDASWYEIFGKAKLEKVFRIFLKLDADKKEVRAQDHEYSVQWSAGVPSLKMAVSSFKGQMNSVEFGTGFAFTETMAPGQVYKYKFNTNELKKPIQDAVATCGWKYKGVAFGKL
jgi:hypothetical protein